MSKDKNKPLKEFEIVFLKKWYYVEIYTQTRVEIYTETQKEIDEYNINILVKYLKMEGFLDLQYLNEK